MFTEIHECYCCGGSRLEGYLNLGNQPLANDYPLEPQDQARFPLEVCFCLDCFHSQLGVQVDPEVMFSEYLYVSGTTATFRNHCAELAAEAMKRIDATSPVALDIACNDGTLLESFRSLGATVIGVDPAKNLRPITERKGIDVVVDLWSLDVASSLKERPHIITGTNVLAHTGNPLGFLAAARSALAEGGTVIVEFPYALNMFREGQFDQIYHEHLSYFSVGPFAALATRAGMRIEEVTISDIHGGSLRLYLRPGTGHCPQVDEHKEIERREGLTNPRFYAQFREKVESRARALQIALRAKKNEGYRLVAYGASAKGNTLMNFVNLGIEYVIDDNELKCGRVTPGIHVPIRPAASLSDDREKLCVLVLAWNFLAEIVGRVRDRRAGLAETCFATYVPDVRIVPLSDF